MWLLEPSDPTIYNTALLFDNVNDLTIYIIDHKSMNFSLRFIAVYVPPPPKEDSNQKITQPLVPLSRSNNE